MNTITTTLATVAMFSDDGKKRYLLRKLWDEKMPSLAIIMLAPSEASGIELDTTTQLVLNNASRLGYGSVTIVNLFATLNDFKLQQAEDEDSENLKEILLAAKNADQVVYAPGVGKSKNKAFAQRQEQILNALRPYEVKLCCLCNESGNARLQHPLSPAVRIWHLSPLKISELLPDSTKNKPEPKKIPKAKPTKKETKAE
jgi:hypothetical protein